MRTAIAIVLACCLATSSATFGIFRSKTGGRRQIQPVEGYRHYLPPPAVSVPSSAFTKHVATYRVSPPPLPPLPPPPVPGYVVPQAYSVPVYTHAVAVGYSVPSLVGYPEPYASAQVVEEQYSACDENDGSFGWK